jgi:hypothetical protein
MLLQVYKGMLPTVELVAVKRPKKSQGRKLKNLKLRLRSYPRSHSPGTGCFGIGQRLDIYLH